MRRDNINTMRLKDFYKLPHRKNGEDIGLFDYVVLLPVKVTWRDWLKYYYRNYILREKYGDYKPGMHDSGYRLMDFVAVRANKPIATLSGVSDVLHINGIGGYGYKWSYEHAGVPNAIPPIGWNMDCLAKSGLYRLWANDHMLRVDEISVSSFQVFAIKVVHLD